MALTSGVLRSCHRLRFIPSLLRSYSTASTETKPVNETWVEKLLYNSVLENAVHTASIRGKFSDNNRNLNEMAIRVSENNAVATPIALKILGLSEEILDEEEEIKEEEQTEETKPQLPFTLFSNPNKEVTEVVKRGRRRGIRAKPTEHWMDNYGEPDPSVPSSKIPCGGCGALLHCQDTAIPGFVPVERFKNFDESDLKSEICQRCYFLEAHKTALNVSVSPENYPNVLKGMDNMHGTAILVVDVTDFPCSIWPGIGEILGPQRPVILVGNKIDLLPPDSSGYLSHVKQCLERTIFESGLSSLNLIHTALVSCSTSYGIEELITFIFQKWQRHKGDLFIVGCTNVGKSSLFNAFLQSDLCTVQVGDIVQRATVSAWPGTTLNLLKFPMARPNRNFIEARIDRLKDQKEEMLAEKKVQMLSLKATRSPRYSKLIGMVGRSVRDKDKVEEAHATALLKDPFAVNPMSTDPPHSMKPERGNWDPDEFHLARWCYDTPGTVSRGTLLNKLTLTELMAILPRDMIKPRSFYLRKGNSMFVGALARIDYLDGDSQGICLTLFAAPRIPVTISNTEDAEEIYEQGKGTEIMGVPIGGTIRFAEFPPLLPTQYEVEGRGLRNAAADFVLSSAGWVSVTGRGIMDFNVFTPGGEGSFFRCPPLLPHHVDLKGKRIRGTSAYNAHRPFVPNILN